MFIILFLQWRGVVLVLVCSCCFKDYFDQLQASHLRSGSWAARWHCTTWAEPQVLRSLSRSVAKGWSSQMHFEGEEVVPKRMSCGPKVCTCDKHVSQGVYVYIQWHVFVSDSWNCNRGNLWARAVDTWKTVCEGSAWWSSLWTLTDWFEALVGSSWFIDDLFVAESLVRNKFWSIHFPRSRGQSTLPPKTVSWSRCSFCPSIFICFFLALYLESALVRKRQTVARSLATWQSRCKKYK